MLSYKTGKLLMLIFVSVYIFNVTGLSVNTNDSKSDSELIALGKSINKNTVTKVDSLVMSSKVLEQVQDPELPVASSKPIEVFREVVTNKERCNSSAPKSYEFITKLIDKI